MYGRTLSPPEKGSFFLFGPRGVGKTTWLKAHFKTALRFDLLSAKTFLELSRDPTLLEARIGEGARHAPVVIDEIQKLPILLDEVHRLMEDRRLLFALTGSSARKLKRSAANLLAGRAVTRLLFPLTSVEMGSDFDLPRALQWGGLPQAVRGEDPADFLQSYFYTYLKEEIQEEGLVRQIDPFVRFLEVASLMNAQVMNVENISRDTGSKRVTIDQWFGILEDTLVGFRLPAWRPAVKVREVAHPKFYWFDPGVARAAAGLLNEALDRVWLGWSFETWMLHEIRAYNHYARKHRALFHYTLPSGQDIDLIVETKKALPHSMAEIVGIELKHSPKWKREWEGPLRDLATSKRVKVRRLIGVYCGSDRLTFDRFEVWPVAGFLTQLHAGAVF